GECWKDLGRPEQVQFDNARELAGWGPAARTLSRVIRLCLRFGVGPGFIPKGEPQFNGSVEEFHGWCEGTLLQRGGWRRGGAGGGAGGAAGGGQPPACPPATRGLDAGTAPPGPAAAEAAGELRGTDRTAAAVGGARDLHPAGECGRDGHGAQPVVSRGEEATGPLPAPGREHRARVTDGVPERARPEALALQVIE